MVANVSLVRRQPIGRVKLGQTGNEIYDHSHQCRCLVSANCIADQTGSAPSTGVGHAVRRPVHVLHRRQRAEGEYQHRTFFTFHTQILGTRCDEPTSPARGRPLPRNVLSPVRLGTHASHGLLTPG